MTPHTSSSLWLLFAVAAPVGALTVACGTSSSGRAGTGAGSRDGAPDPGSAGALDDAAIEAESASYASFARMNVRAYPTRQHLGNSNVNVFANALAAPIYRTLDFGIPADGRIAFPPGAMMVKEMLDGSGTATVLTVMYKKAPGYDPAHGDWWYGRLDLHGTPTDPAYAGRVDFCVGCHTGAAASDFAWGVAATNK